MPIHFVTPAIFIPAVICLLVSQISKQSIGDKKIIYVCITSVKIEGAAYFESKSSH